MAIGTQYAQIQIRRDTAANWTSEDPTLASGEWGLETDTDKMKIGDGSTSWSSLGYYLQNQIASAWVNFNGTGTVAIRDSYNVDSITDLGTGSYKINFTTALANTNYSIVCFSSGDGVSGTIGYESNSGANRDNALTTSVNIVIVRVDTSALADRSSINVAIIGGVA